MLKLSDGQPFWLDLLPGVRLQLEPVTSASYLLAQTAMRDVLRAAPPTEGGEVAPETLALARIAFCRVLAERGLKAWDGVQGPDGKPAEVKPETVAQLLDFYPAFEALERRYAAPLLEAEAEKNGSSPSPAGPSSPTGATTTAGDASPTRASAAPSAPAS